eukprot:jgi/Galph1/1560/GphlegSOOS_G231.1
MLSIHLEGKNPDLTTVAAVLHDLNLLEEIGDSGRKITSLGFDFSSGIENLFFKAEQSLFKCFVRHFLDLENKLNNNKLKLNGISSGFEDLDSMTQGLQRSDLIIIAGRPSMGKTALALNIVFNACKKEKMAAAIFSLEMSKQQIIYRLLSYESSISLTKLRSGRLSTEDWKLINQILRDIQNFELYIDDTSYCSITAIRSKIKRLFSKRVNLGLISTRIISNYKSSKNISKEFDVPIIVLSQLSRAVESRLNKRPLLSDLRESGCLTKNTMLNSYNLLTNLSIEDLYINKLINYDICVLNSYKYTYQILCERGLYLRLTSNHKILTNNGWKRIDFLTKKDKVYSICYSSEISDNQLNKKTKDNIFIKSVSIINILYYSKAKVYDIEIPDHKNFIANHIVVHNSIEQDADLVLMLYRQDYYMSNKLNDNLCEIIITKQRNGPIGTIKLKFEPTTT